MNTWIKTFRRLLMAMVRPDEFKRSMDFDAMRVAGTSFIGTPSDWDQYRAWAKNCVCGRCGKPAMVGGVWATETECWECFLVRTRERNEGHK